MSQNNGLMKGKRGLIMGVANDRSIAWGIAKAVHDQGAELAFTYQGDALKKRVVPLADSIGSKIVLPCDVTATGSIDIRVEGGLSPVGLFLSAESFLVTNAALAGAAGDIGTSAITLHTAFDMTLNGLVRAQDAGSDASITAAGGIVTIGGFIEAQDQLAVSGGLDDGSNVSVLLTRLVYDVKLNADGQIVDDQGHLIDRDGFRLAVDGGGHVRTDGRGRAFLLDPDGRIVTAAGAVVAVDGAGAPILEPDGDPVLTGEESYPALGGKAIYILHAEDGSVATDAGQPVYIDKEGRRVDADGRLIDAGGRLLDDAGYVVGNDGYRIDGAGRRIDENGYLINERGQLLDAAGHAITPYGDRIDERGNLMEEKAGEPGVGSGRLLSADGYLINADGLLVNADAGQTLLALARQCPDPASRSRLLDRTQRSRCKTSA